MSLFRWAATSAFTLVAFGCTPFHTASEPDGSASVAPDGGTDAAPPSKDAGGHDATSSNADASGIDGADAATTDAPAPLDTVCGFPWSEQNTCAGILVTSLGSVEDSDDPRISFARSENGQLGLCYGDISTEDFLTRAAHAITFKPPGVTFLQPTSILLFQGSESDTTPACAIGGGPGSTFHVLVNDTDDSVLGYGVIDGSGMPAYSLFGPSPIEGYLYLGVVDLGSSGLLAAVGSDISETIQSYVVTPVDGGGATFGNAVTVEAKTGINLVGAGAFSLRGGSTPLMLIDDDPGDAGSRVDLAAWNGSSWKVITVEGQALDAALGYSPSLAVTDAGWTGVYYEQNPVFVDGGGMPDAGTSQLHVATSVASHITVTEPLPRSYDNEPESPLVGAAAAIGPDGRLFIAYVAYSSTTHNEVLYLTRPESAVPGAPYITDTIDDQLSAADPPSVNLIVEPSGRVDIVYMRLLSHSVYYATRAP